MRIQSLQWVLGIYCALIGTLMLIVPHQFSSPTYVFVQPQLMLWGSLFLSTGIILIAVATLAPPRWLLIAAHLLAVVPLLVVAVGFAQTTIWTGTANFLMMSLALLCAPILSRGEDVRSQTNLFWSHDLFAVMIGFCAIIMGLIILMLPAQFVAPFYDLVRPHLPWYGGALLGTGLLLVGIQLTQVRSHFVFWAVHILVAGAFLPFLTISVVSHTWTGVVFYGGFGLTIAILPWLGQRLRLVDPAALQTRLTLVLVAIVTLPLIAMVAIGTTSYERQATQEALARQQNLANVLAQDVTTYVRLHRAPVAGIAAYPDFLTMPAARQRTMLEGFGQAYPDMVAFASFDAMGAGIVRSDSRLPASAKGLPIYEQARATNQPTFDILISPVIHRPIFAFGYPVLDANGQFAGVITGVLEATRLANVLAHSGMETNGSVYLVDQAGRAIAHPDERVVSTFALLTDLPPVAAFTRAAEAGMLRYGVPDTEVLAAYTPVEGFGWGVIVERPVSDALGGVRMVRERVFGVLVLLIVLSSLLGAWMSRRLAAPLRMLTRAVADFANGTGTTPLPTTTLSEVAHLAAGFATMRQQIQTRTHEREQVEIRLRGQERQLAKAQEIAHVGSWEWDILNNAIVWSPELYRIYGRPRTGVAVRYETFLEYIHPDDRARVGTTIAEALENHQPFQFDHRIVQPDGTIRDQLAMGEVEVDSSGQPLRMIGIGQDITHRKRTEEELRTSKDVAERASRAKSEFLSTVSHELRTPLTSIRGSLGLVTGGVTGPVSAAAKTMLDIAYKNSERLVRLINDILDIEKIESGKMAFDVQLLELAPLVEQAIEANRGYAEQFGVTYVLAHAEPGLQVNGNADRLIQVLINLLSNAAKFSPVGGTVIVSARQHEATVRVTVEDRGMGIPDEFRSRIFQKFAQADSSDTRQKGGTGLGLSIARAIVEKLGGHIGYTSEPGLGTTFFFDLPVAADSVFPESLNMKGSGHIHILICANDHTVAQRLSMLLAKEGCVTDIASDTAHARQLLAQRHYDGMTLDLQMQEHEGLAFIRELRGQEQTRMLPIVVVSIVAGKGHAYLQGGAVELIDWIEQPIDPSRLHAALTWVLQSREDLRPRILHVEDDPDIVAVVEHILGSGASLDVAEGVREARRKLDEEQFDLVILDLLLADGSGADLLPLLSERGIPAVIFSVYDVPVKVAAHAAAALLKSSTSNQAFVETITAVLKRDKVLQRYQS